MLSLSKAFDWLPGCYMKSVSERKMAHFFNLSEKILNPTLWQWDSPPKIWKESTEITLRKL